MNKKVFQLLVDNTAGALSRISGLFSRRGYNIESLTAGVTADPRFSRITIVAYGDDEILDQIEKQVEKLVDVRSIKVLTPGEAVFYELCLVKVEVLPEQRESLIAISNLFHCKACDVTPKSMIFEITGNADKIESFLRMLEGYTILELARTGVTGLSRGCDDVVWLDPQ